jgi:hypothetical protein
MNTYEEIKKIRKMLLEIDKILKKIENPDMEGKYCR